MSIKNDDIIKALSKMNIVDLMDLIKEIEVKFNISSIDVAPVASGQAGQLNETPQVVEQVVFSVIMTSYGTSKINVIKNVRSLLELGLKEAKEFVENLPATIKKDVSKDEAMKIKSDLESIGAKIDIK